MRKHPYHLVDPSPWPIVASMAALLLTVGGVMYMHGYSGGELILFFGIGVVVYSMFVWWRDVIRESTFQGHHTKAVQTGLRYGMILFIVSEIMFFVAFFWAFFHSSLAPTVEFLGIAIDIRCFLWSVFSSLLFSVLFLGKLIGWKQLKTKQSIIVELKKKKWLLWFFKLDKKTRILIKFSLLLMLFLFFYWFFSHEILSHLLFQTFKLLSINSGCTKKKTAGAAEPEKGGSTSSKANSSSTEGQAGSSRKADSSYAKGQDASSSKGSRSSNKEKNFTSSKNNRSSLKAEAASSSKESKYGTNAQASNAGKESNKLTQQALERIMHQESESARKERQSLQDQLKKRSLDDREEKTVVSPLLEYEKGGSKNQVTKNQQGEDSGDDSSPLISMNIEDLEKQPGAGTTAEELGTFLGKMNISDLEKFSYFKSKKDEKKGD